VIQGILPTSGFPPVGGYTFIVGAVEVYSGYSSMNEGNFQPFPLSGTEEAIYKKLRVRALREMIAAYKDVGLSNVWSVINALYQLTRQPPLPLHNTKGHWGLTDAPPPPRRRVMARSPLPRYAGEEKRPDAAGGRSGASALGALLPVHGEKVDAPKARPDEGPRKRLNIGAAPHPA
jgi:hypothetical protein